MESKNNYKKTTNYLRYNLNYNVHQARSIIAQYGKQIVGYVKPQGTYYAVEVEYFKAICDHIQQNWQEFMDFYGTIKDNYPKDRPNQKEIVNGQKLKSSSAR